MLDCHNFRTSNSTRPGSFATADTIFIAHIHREFLQRCLVTLVNSCNNKFSLIHCGLHMHKQQVNRGGRNGQKQKKRKTCRDRLKDVRQARGTTVDIQNQDATIFMPPTFEITWRKITINTLHSNQNCLNTHHTGSWNCTKP